MIEYRYRNNSSIKRDDLHREFIKLVGIGHVVDKTTPEIVICVEVFQKTCGFSILNGENLIKYKMYNIRTIVEIVKGIYQKKVPQNQGKKRKIKTNDDSSDEETEPRREEGGEATTELEFEEVNAPPEPAANASDSDDEGGISLF